MDLYEALKQGMTEEELLKNFHRELGEAKQKFSKEQEKDQLLNDARESLIECLLNYIEILTDTPLETKERKETFSMLYKILQESENEDFKKVNNFFTFKYKFDDNDLNIIKNFIKDLK